MISYFITHRQYGIVKNELGGYLLRTKSKESNEGGVATGFAALDSLLI